MPTPTTNRWSWTTMQDVLSLGSGSGGPATGGRFAESARLEAEIRANLRGSSMARKKSATPKARKTNPARPGRRSPARREPAADALPASYAAS